MTAKNGLDTNFESLMAEPDRFGNSIAGALRGGRLVMMRLGQKRWQNHRTPKVLGGDF